MFKKKIKTFKQISTNISVEENENNLIYFSKLFINVEYFIFFGTLLGITRDKGLIDGDDDIDFYVNLKDRFKLIENLKNNNIEVDLTLSVNKNNYFLQIKRVFNKKILITDFYFYETDIEKNFIIERWNFEGGTHDTSKYLRIPKIFIFPLKKILFKSVEIFIPKESELTCEFLYGINWKKKLKKDKEYTIKVINGKPYLFIIKKFLFFKKLFLSL
jgi:phosphorylcholine metabolism protein LicD|tara:strand:+ start:72 stop:719 length:648 start_codon:yes stop_codon:yes gene_type:complete